MVKWEGLHHGLTTDHSLGDTCGAWHFRLVGVTGFRHLSAWSWAARVGVSLFGWHDSHPKAVQCICADDAEESIPDFVRGKSACTLDRVRLQQSSSDDVTASS
jgi:hypothetical protein